MRWRMLLVVFVVVVVVVVVVCVHEKVTRFFVIKMTKINSELT